MNKYIKLVLVLAFILGMAPAGGGEGKTDDFNSFVAGLRNAARAGDAREMAKFIKFPLITGTGGDAFYVYDSIVEGEFVSDFYQVYISPFAKKLKSLKKSAFKKIIKKGANLVSFTYGSNDEGLSDGRDYAASIPDGTVIYVYETCDGPEGPCIAFFASVFGDGYRIWGITYGR